MIPHDALQAINAALKLLPGKMDSPEARVMLLAIGLQESRLRYRFQKVAGKPKAKGPARGLWQFERGGGARGVIRHAASRYWMASVCEVRGLSMDARTLWARLEGDDVLAVAAARLLLFTDPKRLPALGDADGAWDLYMRVWRPGKPHPDTWRRFYLESLAEVTA